MGTRVPMDREEQAEAERELRSDVERGQDLDRGLARALGRPEPEARAI
ncbi:MAG: hypothetical protein JWO90_3185, partial [Solirubrobacterales bacterium]|nr:hypothetical protein [Solirubrobacterales bacterium]